MNRLIIVGAGGHGKVIADSALKCGYTNICFVDDHKTGDVLGFPIVGTGDDIESLNDGRTDFVLGIGNNAVRRKIAENHHVNWVSVVHPSAQVSFDVKIGKGTVVLANAVINVSSVIGEHCIINTGAIVEHDNVIEDYVHLSPGVKLSGVVTVGENTWIGTGTSVINNVEICENVIVGVGSVVIKSIKKQGTYFGIISKQTMD